MSTCPIAERHYYLLVVEAGADIVLLRQAIAFGIRQAGMAPDHPHIRAMEAYCAAHETFEQAATLAAATAQSRNSGKVGRSAKN